MRTTRAPRNSEDTPMSELKHGDYVNDVNSILSQIEEDKDVSFNISDDEISSQIEEYKEERIEPSEGYVYVAREIIRQAGVENPNEYIYSGGSGGRQGTNPEPDAEEITETDDWITFEGCVIETSSPDTDGLIQTGTLADETGTINFTIWAKDGENPVETTLETGQSYRLESVVTDEFEQAGQMELNLRQVTEVSELTGDDAFDIDPENYEETISGAVVGFVEPMGLVDKCSNNECGRVYQEDECPNCGSTEPELTLRTKAILDTGDDTWTFILDSKQTEDNIGLSKKDAEELVRDHNDREAVKQYIEGKIHGEYWRLHGRDYGRNFQVNEVDLIDTPTITNLESIKSKIADLP
jgi:replication factor A1